MDQKQLSQLDPKLKAVYDRVMGIANTPPPAPPQISPPAQTPPQMPPAPQRPAFVVEEVPNQHPPVMSSSQPLPQPPPPPPHTTQPQVFFTQDTGNVPSFRPAPPPSMQNLHATMPVAQMPQNSLSHQEGSSHGFMILFIILGIIFFILYGIFWVQLFNIGIPALTSS